MKKDNTMIIIKNDKKKINTIKEIVLFFISILFCDALVKGRVLVILFHCSRYIIKYYIHNMIIFTPNVIGSLEIEDQ